MTYKNFINRKLENSGKLRVNGEYALILNELFQKLNLPGHSDLDVIATYLAFQIHYGFLDEEKLYHIKKLTIQIAETLAEFDEQEKYKKI